MIKTNMRQFLDLLDEFYKDSPFLFKHPHKDNIERNLIDKFAKLYQYSELKEKVRFNHYLTIIKGSTPEHKGIISRFIKHFYGVNNDKNKV